MTGLKLRDDAYYSQTSDGICVLTNDGTVVLTGPSIFQWVDRLAPYLDGRHTLAELTATMPAARREMTERVIHALREQRVIVEADGTEADGGRLTDAERRVYRREIGFLGYFGPSAEQSFQAYRDSLITLIGAGRLLEEAAEAALCSGTRRLRVVVIGQGPTDMAMLAECQRRARRRDPDQLVTLGSVDLADQSQLSAAVDGAGIVLHLCDRAAIDEARLLDRACARLGIGFVSAMFIGDEAWFGPFGSMPGIRPDWTSAWRRLAALDGAREEPGSAPGGREGPVPTTVANQLIRQVVRLLSGTAEPTAQAEMTRVDLPSLATHRHRFLPHPFSLPVSSPDQASMQEAVRRLGEGERVDTEEFSRRATACVQARLGVLSEVTEEDFAQVPLAVSQVQVSDPVLLLGPDVPHPVVTGADLSLADARRAAVVRGLAVYASLMVDPRRLHVCRDAADPRTGDPDDDLRSLRDHQWDGFVWGYGLSGGLPREIPATAVFPALRGASSAYLAPAGAAAGYDWRDAVRRGLIGECRRLTIAEVLERRTGPTPIEWTDVVLDDRGDRLRSMVKIIGERLDVYDITGSAGVPALAFCLGGSTAAYSAGFSFAQALRDGLADVLLRHQAQASGQTGYAPPAVLALPSRGRPAPLAACPDWSTDEAATATRLGRLGWTVAAVPLDHDPALATSVIPYLVTVVLTRA